MGNLTRVLRRLFRRRPAAPPRRAVDDGQLTGMRFHACADPVECGAGCCRRGVQMLERDAQRIIAFIQAHPEHFGVLRGVPAPFYRSEVASGVHLYATEIVTDAGPGRHGVYGAERAGQIVSAEERKSARCVFLHPDGRCALQLASVALGHHKWAFKPTPCWLFPLRVAFAGERDGARCYRLEYGAGQSGLADAPCGRLDPHGAPAEEALAAEIACFREWFEREPERFINEVPAERAATRAGPAAR